MEKYTYAPGRFCIAKGKYINHMIIKRDSSKFYIGLRHVMDGQGGYTNYYHIYSNEEFTENMEYRPRRDGDIYYLKLSREDVIKLLGRQAVEF